MNGFYKSITALFHYSVPALLRYRYYKNKETKRSLTEKMGRYHNSLHQREQKLIIRIHGASVGEVISALSVMHELNQQHHDIFFILTSSTISSAEYIKQRLPENSMHVFAPLDTPQIVRRFYNYYKPKLELIIDSEIWPNALCQAKKLSIPIVGLNTRLSENSIKFWNFLPNSLRSILNCYHAFYVQNQATAHFLKKHYQGHVTVAENLKWLIAPPPYQQNEYDDLKKILHHKFVIALYSTHEPEELEIVKKFLEYGFFNESDHILMIAPRHLVRSNKLFDELTKIIPAQFITRRSKNEPITEQTKIYFSDTMGDITLIASLSDILFMGNSLSVKGGGHNPIEPASIGTGIITGHKLKNFTEIYNIFRQENSCIFADNPDDLIRKIIILKNNAYLLSQITEKSYNLCKKYRQSALLPINDISQLIHHLQHR